LYVPAGLLASLFIRAQTIITQTGLAYVGGGKLNVGMVFGIITAILVMIFVIIFASDQISNMFCAGSVAQTNKAVMNLEEIVDDIYYAGLDSSDLYTMRLPDNAKVCFINTDDPRPNIALGWSPEINQYPIIEQIIQLQDYNTWIEYNCGPDSDPGYKISYMVVPNSFCTTSGDRVYLKNKGMTVEVVPGG